MRYIYIILLLIGCESMVVDSPSPEPVKKYKIRYLTNAFSQDAQFCSPTGVQSLFDIYVLDTTIMMDSGARICLSTVKKDEKNNIRAGARIYINDTLRYENYGYMRASVSGVARNSKNKYEIYTISY